MDIIPGGISRQRDGVFFKRESDLLETSSSRLTRARRPGNVVPSYLHRPLFVIMNQIYANKGGASTRINSKNNAPNSSSSSSNNNSNRLFVFFVFCLLVTACVINIQTQTTAVGGLGFGGGGGGIFCSLYPSRPLSSSNNDTAYPVSLRKGQAARTTTAETSLLEEAYSSPQNASSSILSISSPSATTTMTKKKRHAYAFYVTNEGYACGAFVNIAALLEAGATVSTTDFVILTYGFDTTAIEQQAARMGGIIVKPVEHLNNFRGGGMVVPR